MSRLIDDFKNRISSYDKEYEFSQEEVLNILARYEIKYGNAQSISLDKVKQAREKINNKIERDPYLMFKSINRDRNDAFVEVLEILDKLISESEEK